MRKSIKKIKALCFSVLLTGMGVCCSAPICCNNTFVNAANTTEGGSILEKMSVQEEQKNCTIIKKWKLRQKNRKKHVLHTKI